MISAWSTGPWATGVKFCELMEHFTLVKNTGTDIDDIKKTLKTFGKDHHYIIAGYPIFLQSMLESDFPWKEYDIDLATGGDAYSALWPGRMKKKLKSSTTIVSSYGCSDIDIGIGFESSFAQAIREEAAHNPGLAEALFGKLPTFPMLFQYNPTMHYIHNLSNGEFGVTHLDAYVASPKIKYNVHDFGGSIRFSHMMDVLEHFAPDLLKNWGGEDILHLPFLYIAGRSDGTLSFDGANVFPDQVDMILSELFAKQVNHFKMLRKEKGKKIFYLLVELRKGVRKTQTLVRSIEKSIRTQLPLMNKDYKESLENNRKLAPNVVLYSFNTGPFKDVYKKVKYKYIEK